MIPKFIKLDVTLSVTFKSDAIIIKNARINVNEIVFFYPHEVDSFKTTIILKNGTKIYTSEYSHVIDFMVEQCDNLNR